MLGRFTYVELNNAHLWQQMRALLLKLTDIKSGQFLESNQSWRIKQSIGVGKPERGYPPQAPEDLA
jgi:hypothetical protein